MRGDGAGRWSRVGSAPVRSGRRRRVISPCRLGRRGATLRVRRSVSPSVRPSVPSRHRLLQEMALSGGHRALCSPSDITLMNMHEPGAHRPRSGESPRPPPPLRRPRTGPGLRAPGRAGRGGSGRGGVWRRRPSRAAPPGGLVSRAPGAGDPHPRELPGHRLSPYLHVAPLEPRRTIQPPRAGDLGRPPGLSPPQAEALPGRAEPHLIYTAPPAPSPLAGPLQLLPSATLLTVRPLAPGMPVTPSRRLSCGGAPAR